MFNKIFSIVLVILIVISLVLSCIVLINNNTKDKPSFVKISLPKRTNLPGVSIIRIYGPIDISSSYSPFDPYGGTGSDAILKRLDEIKNNKNIKAVILRINSPGGTIGSVQEICQKIQEMKSNGMIFVASLADICASGGYYIASVANRIIANPGTLTGSIGVIISDLEFSELMKKFGIKEQVIKSGKHKDLLSPFRSMTKEERNLLQDVVDDSYEQFFKTVYMNRKIPIMQLKKIADGRVFTGRQAKEYGLVDELGNFDTAIKIAGRLAGLGENPKIYEENIVPLDYFTSVLSYFKVKQKYSIPVHFETFKEIIER